MYNYVQWIVVDMDNDVQWIVDMGNYVQDNHVFMQMEEEPTYNS